MDNNIKKIYWIYGNSGCGKTRKAMDIIKNQYNGDYWQCYC